MDAWDLNELTQKVHGALELQLTVSLAHREDHVRALDSIP